MKRSIDGWIMGWELGWMGWLGAEVEKASNPTPGAGFREVRTIAGNVHHHVGFFVPEDSVGVGSGIL